MKWTDESPSNELPAVPAQLLSARAARVLSAGPHDGLGAMVLIAPDVHAQVLTHLRNLPVEQGGLLIGIPYADAQGHPVRICITDAVAADQSTGTGYSLRMEAGVWSAANRVLANAREASGHGANAIRVVGWYHSHPGLSAFFSSTDMATQAAFFSHAYSIGWVIDPTNDTHAAYIGARSDELGCAICDQASYSAAGG